MRHLVVVLVEVVVEVSNRKGSLEPGAKAIVIAGEVTQGRVETQHHTNVEIGSGPELSVSVLIANEWWAILNLELGVVVNLGRVA